MFFLSPCDVDEEKKWIQCVKVEKLEAEIYQRQSWFLYEWEQGERSSSVILGRGRAWNEELSDLTWSLSIYQAVLDKYKSATSKWSYFGHHEIGIKESVLMYVWQKQLWVITSPNSFGLRCNSNKYNNSYNIR